MIKCFFRAQLITCLSLKTQALESFWGLYRELLDNYLLFMPMSRLRVRARVRRPSQRCQARSELNLLLLTIPEVRTEVYLLLLTISEVRTEVCLLLLTISEVRTEVCLLLLTILEVRTEVCLLLLTI